MDTQLVSEGATVTTSNGTVTPSTEALTKSTVPVTFTIADSGPQSRAVVHDVDRHRPLTVLDCAETRQSRVVDDRRLASHLHRRHHNHWPPLLQSQACLGGDSHNHGGVVLEFWSKTGSGDGLGIWVSEHVDVHPRLGGPLRAVSRRLGPA